MSRYWTHAAMLLLGISLTVGFYEGRRLVRNTSRALSAMSQLGSASERRERAEEADAVAEAPRPRTAARAAGADAEPRRSARSGGGGRNKTPRNVDPARMERINALNQVRGRSKLQRIEPQAVGRGRPPGPVAMPGGPAGPVGPRELPALDELDEELVDTGLE